MKRKKFEKESEWMILTRSLVNQRLNEWKNNGCRDMANYDSCMKSEKLSVVGGVYPYYLFNLSIQHIYTRYCSWSPSLLGVVIHVDTLPMLLLDSKQSNESLYFEPEIWLEVQRNLRWRSRKTIPRQYWRIHDFTWLFQ